MPSLDRSKLIKICGMLGSDYEGERASAALLASNLLKTAGVSWSDLIGVEPITAAPPNAARPTTAPVDWRFVVGLCMRHPDLLAKWELDLVSLLLQSRTPKAKYLRSLYEMGNRVWAAGRR